MSRTDIVGLEDVISLLKEVEKVSIRTVTKAAKAGANIALKDAQGKCPVSENGQQFGSYQHPPGNLKKSLKLKLEKKRTEGKRVYQVGPDSSGWYAHFVDYGYTDRTGRYHQGNRFLRDSVDNNRTEINSKVMQTLASELEKVR